MVQLVLAAHCVLQEAPHAPVHVAPAVQLNMQPLV
jgi:hypothetical protein